jgi:riboflavin synthase
MFTGLIEGIGKIKDVRRTQDDMRVTIIPLFEFSDCKVGDSICVDGVCLTVTGIKEGAYTMDVSGETISRSTIGLLREGGEVNLERALRLMDRLGGHLVSGHVDGTGRIIKKEPKQRFWLLRIEIAPQLSRHTIEKGSIAVDGVSLTINRREDRFFEVNIVPQTGKKTTLLKKRVGDLVNIETDLIGKYVEKFFLGARQGQQDTSSGIELEMLLEQGFGK